MNPWSRLLLPGLVAGLLTAAPSLAQNDDAAGHPYTPTPVEVGAGATSAPGAADAAIPGIETLATPAGNTLATPASSDTTRTYTVRAGDCLARIAKVLLGDPTRFTELVRLNADRYPSLLKNPNLIFAGWTLRIPGDGTTATDEPVRTAPPAVAATPTEGATTPATAAPADPTAANPTTPAANPTAAAPTGAGLIGPSSRVLHIGDSHTVGAYGSTIDDLMRGTGAKVDTVGVAGSSPSWWQKGTVTKCGYFSRDENGKVVRPADWRTPMPTPDIRQLIRDFKPNIVVVSLGANMIGASESRIKSEVASLCEIAKANGCQIVWVGPPNGRADKKPEAVQNRLCEALAKAVAPYGTFVDSRPHTRYPASGGDGVHFGGSEGTRIAKSWANAVFAATQKIPAKQ